jgi:hypothetical protein
MDCLEMMVYQAVMGRLASLVQQQVSLKLVPSGWRPNALIQTHTETLWTTMGPISLPMDSKQMVHRIAAGNVSCYHKRIHGSRSACSSHMQVVERSTEHAG